MSSWVIFLISPFKNFAWKMNRIFVNEFRLLSIVSLFIELAGNLRSYRWSRNAATANNSRKQLWDVNIVNRDRTWKHFSRNLNIYELHETRTQLSLLCFRLELIVVERGKIVYRQHSLLLKKYLVSSEWLMRAANEMKEIEAGARWSDWLDK